MLKCCRLRWVWAPQYRSAGTCTSPRLSNSRRVPVARSPIGTSRTFGSVSLAMAMMGTLLTSRGRVGVGRLPYRVLDGLHEVIGLPGGHAVIGGGPGHGHRRGRRGGAQVLHRGQQGGARLADV